ncbi:MAG TPA: hypothetical protein VJN88_09215, partial [Ktedonobacterales bacterium]|nr:hypothetical protein [Ktedonobacterales bacterium]
PAYAPQPYAPQAPQGGYSTPLSQPVYSPPPSQPIYPGQSQPGYTVPPSQPYYPTQPPQPAYSPPPSQPLYAQSTPGMYEAPYAPPQYAPPASAPLAPGQQYATYTTARQPGAPFMPQVFGYNADPNTAQPATRLQAYLLKNVSRQYAVSKWFAATVGGVVAVIVGLLLTIPAQELWKKTLSIGGFDLLGGGTGGLSGGAPLGALDSPGVFTFFPVENHVPLTFSESGISVSITLPLLGLFIVPMVALILGGYISASSDYSRRARFSVARGALIAPAYAVCLAIVALVGKHNGIGAQPFLAFLYGLLWGAVFGAIGGWIQQSGGAWLSSLVGRLQAVGNARVVGAAAGAVSALVSVIALGTACAMGYFAFLLTQSAGATRAPDIGAVLRLGVTIGPTEGLYLLSAASGASLDTYSKGTGQVQSTHMGILVNHHHPPNMWQFLIYGAAIAASYIVGGRIAARVARAGRPDQGFAAGALMAVPLSLLMTLAAWLTLTTAGTGNTSGGSFSGGVGLSLGGVFITTLVLGAVIGGIGGASIFTMPALGGLPRVLLLPFRPFGLALNPLLDALSGAPRGQRRSAARSWIYDAALATVVLGVVVIVLDVAGNTLASSISYPLVRALFEFAGALLVGLPIMYLTGALFAELNSGLVAPRMMAPQMMAPQMAVPVMQPVPVGAWGQPMPMPMQAPAEGIAPASWGQAPMPMPMSMPMSTPMPIQQQPFAPMFTPAPAQAPMYSPMPAQAPTITPMPAPPPLQMPSEGLAGMSPPEADSPSMPPEPEPEPQASYHSMPPESEPEPEPQAEPQLEQQPQSPSDGEQPPFPNA